MRRKSAQASARQGELKNPWFEAEPSNKAKERKVMLSWAITFLIIALIAAVFGFAGIAGTAAWIAQILFVVFLILFLISLIFGRRAV